MATVLGRSSSTGQVKLRLSDSSVVFAKWYGNAEPKVGSSVQYDAKSNTANSKAALAPGNVPKPFSRWDLPVFTLEKDRNDVDYVGGEIWDIDKPAKKGDAGKVAVLYTVSDTSGTSLYLGGAVETPLLITTFPIGSIFSVIGSKSSVHLLADNKFVVGVSYVTSGSFVTRRYSGDLLDVATPYVLDFEASQQLSAGSGNRVFYSAYYGYGNVQTYAKAIAYSIDGLSAGNAFSSEGLFQTENSYLAKGSSGLYSAPSFSSYAANFAEQSVLSLTASFTQELSLSDTYVRMSYENASLGAQTSFSLDSFFYDESGVQLRGRLYDISAADLALGYGDEAVYSRNSYVKGIPDLGSKVDPHNYFFSTNSAQLTSRSLKYVTTAGESLLPVSEAVYDSIVNKDSSILDSIVSSVTSYDLDEGFAELAYFDCLTGDSGSSQSSFVPVLEPLATVLSVSCIVARVTL